jgi:hypothetical protein
MAKQTGKQRDPDPSESEIRERAAAIRAERLAKHEQRAGEEQNVTNRGGSYPRVYRLAGVKD